MPSPERPGRDEQPGAARVLSLVRARVRLRTAQMESNYRNEPCPKGYGSQSLQESAPSG